MTMEECIERLQVKVRTVRVAVEEVEGIFQDGFKWILVEKEVATLLAAKN